MAQSINASVIECVNQSLHRRGYDPPYDRTQVMGGPHYNYRFETIIALHCQVKKCLKAKGLAYGYPVSNEYFQKSLEMTLRQVYASITSKTGTSVHPDILVTVQASLSDSTLAADSIVPVIAKKAAKKHTAANKNSKSGKKTARKKTVKRKT